MFLYKENLNDPIISFRTNECIIVTVSLFALDIPVTRHQAALRQARFSLP
jgi:hypothetical protein